MSTPLGTQTFATYVDLEEQVQPWLQLGGQLLTSTNKQALELIVDSVCTQAQRFIGGPIAPTQYGPTTGIGTFDGSGGLQSGYIMLPRYPVVSVTKVIEWRGGTGGTEELFTLQEVKPTGTGGGTGYQCNYRTGRLTRVLGGIWNRPFYPGSNNVHVTWTAGFNPIPADIIRATLEWIAHIYYNTQQARGGDVRGDASPEPATLGGLWVGMPNRVADVLKSYVHVGVR